MQLQLEKCVILLFISTCNTKGKLIANNPIKKLLLSASIIINSQIASRCTEFLILNWLKVGCAYELTQPLGIWDYVIYWSLDMWIHWILNLVLTTYFPPINLTEWQSNGCLLNALWSLSFTILLELRSKASSWCLSKSQKSNDFQKQWIHHNITLVKYLMES